MHDKDERHTSVTVQAALIDSATMTVLWMNESAAQAVADRGGTAEPGMPVEGVLPMSEELGVPRALRAAADTGVAQHLRANVVSMARRSVALVVSVYRLPDGTLLMLTEHAWQAGHGRAERRARR